MSLETFSDDDPCWCGQTFRWHMDNQPRHPFGTSVGPAVHRAMEGARRARDPQSGAKTPQRGAQGASEDMSVPSGNPWPFDPVLRQALIDKGVLTPDDLRNAERKIQEMSVVFNQGGKPWSATKEASPDSSTGTGKTYTEHFAEKGNLRP